jgi:hypothetical protein
VRKRKWRSEEVVQSLRVAYGVATSQLVTDEWSFLTEIPLRAPRSRSVLGREYDESFWSNTRTIDVFLVRNWASGTGFQRVAVEVKVTRSDYRNETAEKRAPAERAAHLTYYAAPAGIIEPDTLPEGWGLIEIHATREEWEAAKGWQLGEWNAGQRTDLAKVRVRAVKRVPQCSLEYLVSAGFRRASRAEERIRRGEDDAAQVPALRAQALRLEGQLERREDALVRERERVRRFRTEALAMAGGQVCSECRHPIRLNTAKRNAFGMTWVHDEDRQEGICEEARSEADRVRKETEYGSRYTRGWAEPVWPLAERAEREADTERAKAERAENAAAAE